MGWWKSTGPETGQISCSLPSGHPGRHSEAPVNAVPGRDAPDDDYNGDGPSDIMGKALKDIDAEFQTAWGRPARPDELRGCFNFVLNGRIRAAERERKEMVKQPRVTMRARIGDHEAEVEGPRDWARKQIDRFIRRQLVRIRGERKEKDDG